MPTTDSTIPTITIMETDSNGYITLGQHAGVSSAIPTTASKFAVGCLLEVSADGTQWVNIGTVAVPSWSNSDSFMVQTSLTAALINTLYSAPTQVVPAVAGKSIIVDSLEFDITRTSTAFQSGGAVQVQYDSTTHAGGTAVSATIASTVVTGSAGRSITARIPVVLSDVVSTAIVGKGLYISAASGDFTTGTGTAVVTVRYHLV